MKLKTSLFSLIVFLTALSQANSNDFTLSYETFSDATLSHQTQYEGLRCFEPGYHKTIIRISNLPDSTDFIVNTERPLFGKTESDDDCPLELLVKQASLLGEITPVIVFGSKGYLPGEKVIITLQTQDGKSISQPMTFIPQPVIKEMRSGKDKLHAVLVSLSPQRYELILEGVSMLEKLSFNNWSRGERQYAEFYTKPEGCIQLYPEVVGMEGGFCPITIIRQKDDQFSLTLPWGSELTRHLAGRCPPVVSCFSPVTDLPPGAK